MVSVSFCLQDRAATKMLRACADMCTCSVLDMFRSFDISSLLGFCIIAVGEQVTNRCVDSMILAKQ